MTLKIRLRQQGRTNRQTYRLVLADVKSPRDGKYLEMLGWYNPVADKDNLSVNAERILYWLGLGAQLTEQAAVLVRKAAPEVLKNYAFEKEKRKQAKRVRRKSLKAVAG
ncbi:MAG: 30S ribosomal protein S16 [Rhabdochlamydiaceae bacterium]